MDGRFDVIASGSMLGIVITSVILFILSLLKKTNNKMLTGRTNSNKVVIFEGSEELIGQVIDLKIISEHKWYLRGEI